MEPDVVLVEAPADGGGGGGWKKPAAIAGILLLLFLSFRFGAGKKGSKGSGIAHLRADLQGERVSLNGGPLMSVDSVPLPALGGKPGVLDVDGAWRATTRAVNVLAGRARAAGYMVCVRDDPEADFDCNG